EDGAALTWAGTTLDVLRQRAGDGAFGFRERFARDWTPAPGPAGDRENPNAPLHPLGAMTALAQASGSAAPAATLPQPLSLVINAVHPRHRCAWEDFDHTWGPERRWRRPTAVSYGHGVEAAWLALRAADVLGAEREPLRQPVLGLIDHALAYGFDHARG